ncbi:hypothetical protein ACOMHN_059997 [Nucella lapillus]
MQGEVLFQCLGVLSIVSAVLACSWSNEGCDSNQECCSKSCFRAHEGTNYRCRHSGLAESCVFDYHCGDNLECRDYKCCSPYWKMCTKHDDCCNKEHVCRPAEGFIYKRCLFPAAAPPSAGKASTGIILLMALVVTVVNRWRWWGW